MAHMIYEDYRKSALKHLKTCEFMIDNLQNIIDNDTIDGLSIAESKSHILRNIYYLCGYAIEGVVNYCVYKNVTAFQSNRNKDINELDEDVSSIAGQYRGKNIGLCFRFPNTKPLGLSYKYVIGNHQYAENIEFLKFIFPTAFNNIKVINRPKDATNKLSVMFYDWKVNMRYQTDVTNFNPNPRLVYNEDEILDFFIFVRDDIYSKLPLLR